jgi:hypothetical protein
VLRRQLNSRPLLFTLACVFLLAIWLDRVWLLIQDGGLFRVVGIDWSMYAAQAMVLRAGEPESIYNLSRMSDFVQQLRVYTTDPGEPLAVGPVAYPPVFAWLMIPFTLVPAPVGFGLWTVLNLFGVAHLGRRVAEVVPNVSTVQAALALLVTFPVALGLVAGQPTALLGCAIAECYLSLRSGRDLRAGLWLSILLLKPQYGILLGPILLWKRRWSAVLGVAVGGLLLAVASLAIVGGSTLLTYGAAFADIAPWGGAAVSSPGQMINWRALILNLRPSIGPGTGLLLTAALGLLTVAALLPIWRGPWRPASALFPARMAATCLTTILVNYHSHAHGLTLFTLPLAASYGEQRSGRYARAALLALAFVPTVIVIVIQHWLLREVILRETVDILIWSPLAQILLSIAAGTLLVAVLRSERLPSTPAQRAEPGLEETARQVRGVGTATRS